MTQQTLERYRALLAQLMLERAAAGGELPEAEPTERALEMKHHGSPKAHWPIAAIAALLAAACSRHDDVQVRLTRLRGVDAAVIDWVTVFSGADKRSIELSPGETDRVVLRPDGERPDVILTFRVDGESRSWQGPPLAKGSGYAVDIVIDGDGIVSESHCRMPCELRKGATSR